MENVSTLSLHDLLSLRHGLREPCSDSVSNINLHKLAWKSQTGTVFGTVLVLVAGTVAWVADLIYTNGRTRRNNCVHAKIYASSIPYDARRGTTWVSFDHDNNSAEQSTLLSCLWSIVCEWGWWLCSFWSVQIDIVRVDYWTLIRQSLRWSAAGVAVCNSFQGFSKIHMFHPRIKR